MFERRNYAEDIFAGLMAFLIIAVIFLIIFLYIGYIALIVFLSIGLAIGLAYAIYIYIKSFITIAKKLHTITARGKAKSFFLKWFMLFKDTTKLAFVDNFSIAKAAIIKSHGYKFLSFKKWMWLIVAPATLVFGTSLILAIIILQGMILLAIAFILTAIILLFCSVFLLLDFVYAIIATLKNFGSSFAGKDNIFRQIEFTKSANLKGLGGGIKKYYKVMLSYCKSIWNENYLLSKSNITMAHTYRIFSLQRYFLYLSVVSLMFIAIIVDLVLILGLTLIFAFVVIANLIWLPVALIFRKISP